MSRDLWVRPNVLVTCEQTPSRPLVTAAHVKQASFLLSGSPGNPGFCLVHIRVLEISCRDTPKKAEQSNPGFLPGFVADNGHPFYFFSEKLGKPQVVIQGFRSVGPGIAFEDQQETYLAEFGCLPFQQLAKRIILLVGQTFRDL